MRLLFLSRTHKQKQNPCFTSSLGSSLPLRAGRSSVRAALSHIFCSVLLYFFFFWFFSAAPPPLLPCQRRPLFPFRAVTLLCNQLLQYGLELPKQIGRPTKRRTTVVAPLWVFSAGALYQVLNAEAAMNEIMGGEGGTVEWWWWSRWRWGSLPETSQEFQNNPCAGESAPFPTSQGFRVPLC